jgi:putative transposase
LQLNPYAVSVSESETILSLNKNGKSVRSPGWREDRLSVKTRTGNDLAVEYSHQVWQCDHTWVDVLVVDVEGDIIGRSWLTLCCHRLRSFQ